MKIIFYESKSKEIDIHITVSLKDGVLKFEGQDLGPLVDKLRGMGDEYEYFLTLDKENTQRLFEAMKIEKLSDKEKLEAIRDRCKNDCGISGIEEFCERHDIETKFDSWP